jgi:SAM-dependent methyltransferase
VTGSPPHGPSANPVTAWRGALERWAIPDDLLRAAVDDPWAMGGDIYRERAHAAALTARTPDAIGDRSREAALEALAALRDGAGSVLDVGAGAGAAGLSLGSRLTRLTGVDRNPGLLAALLEEARALGIPARAVEGRWPDVARDVDIHDVVVCHHVLYDVPDLAPFVHALTSHARRRVVVEISQRHPLAWTNPLWRHFHGITRPDRPTPDDAAAALRALGLSPVVVRWERAAEPASVAAAAERARRNLCLPPAREGEVADVIATLVASGDIDAGPAVGRRAVATIWWDAPAS